MDMLEEIFNALDGKGYDDFTKIRWIYLYVCEKFSYDTRYIYAPQSMKEDIYNTKIDITNVEDFEVVCYTLARILVDVLSMFGYKCEIKRETNSTLTHAYVIVYHKDYTLKLDPTKRHDVTRVKMNSTTKDFESLEDNDLFSDELLEADKKIASSFDGLYISKKFIKNKITKILEEINICAKEQNLSKEEIFFKKIEALYEMINSRTDLKRYDDIDFYYSYLLSAFKINYEEVEEGKYIKHNYVKPAILFNVNDKSMKDIINISYIQYNDLPPIFYLLRKEKNSFKIREIFKEEALELLSQYENPFCQYMLEQAAKQLPTSKKGNIIY